MGENLWSVADIVKYAVYKYYLPEGYTANGVLSTDNYEKKIRRTIQAQYPNYICDDSVNIPDTDNNHDSDKKKTKDTYKLPETIARHLVDVELRDYFSKRGNEEIIKHSFFAKDKKFNTDLKEFEKELSHEKLDEISKQMIDEYEFDEYINQCIDRFMLRTLFSLYFDFNEDEYRKDFKNMIEHINLKCDDSESNDSKSDDSKSDVSESDDSKSDVSKSDVSKSDVSESDDSKSNDSKSDDSESDDSESDDSESEGFAKDGYSLLSHRLENPLEYYCKKK